MGMPGNLSIQTLSSAMPTPILTLKSPHRITYVFGNETLTSTPNDPQICRHYVTEFICFPDFPFLLGSVSVTNITHPPPTAY